VKAAAGAAPLVLARRYEELRAQALGEPATLGTGRGLTLFLRRGLVAWLALCQELLARNEDEPKRRSAWSASPTALPSATQSEVVRALASMALAAAQKGGA
jgi:hypothetical protein